MSPLRFKVPFLLVMFIEPFVLAILPSTFALLPLLVITMSLPELISPFTFKSPLPELTIESAPSLVILPVDVKLSSSP